MTELLKRLPPKNKTLKYSTLLNKVKKLRNDGKIEKTNNRS